MKSWRSLAAAGFVAGAAAVVLPLSAGTASAAEADWNVVGGAPGTMDECVAEAKEYLAEPYVDYTEWKCETSDGSWTLFAR
ncbi:hypothetical protein [Nocardiopsis sp. MG754419]|uniref:hypothetical protein n=1 Tax=Nocardiopsis sp. MG754419 TaxID=2259865 RepID=UPI001BAE0E7A|nr:hypothetical protein [Nocardiopsis sp. MG754419]MBR8743956.1 hypothetical protein [Nocardiopsis sp. MG754419]